MKLRPTAGREDPRDDPAGPELQRLCLLLDRTEEAETLRPLVRRIRGDGPRIGVALLCGSDDDAVVDFVERLWQLECSAWLLDMDVERWLEDQPQPPFGISPPRGASLVCQDLYPEVHGGLLTKWAQLWFGHAERFSNDGDVLQRLAAEPSFFVILLSEGAGVRAGDELTRALVRLHQQVATAPLESGVCPGVLVFLWVAPTGDSASDRARIKAMHEALEPAVAAVRLDLFSAVRPPQFHRWWGHVLACPKLFRPSFHADLVRDRLLQQVFGDTGQVPMRRALLAIRSTLAEHGRSAP